MGKRSCARWAGAAVVVLLLATACGTPDAESVEAAPAEPDAGSWTTWVLTSPSEIPVPPPPEPGSAAAEADEAAVRATVEGGDPTGDDHVRRWDVEPALTPWMEMALDFVAHRTKDPVAASRSYALVATAMYDAVIATWHHKHAYGRPGPDAGGLPAEADPPYPSGHAAIAGAASTVLAHAFPEQPAPRLQQEAEEAARSRVVSGVRYPSDVEAGLELGRAVGRAGLERTQSDVVTDDDLTTREGALDWEALRPEGDMLWRQPPGSVQVPVSPMAGSWDTWVMDSGDQFRPGPFPDVHSEEVLGGRAGPTPIFPGYVSGHGADSGAAQVVMPRPFPDHAELFEERAEEASVSRLYAGIHLSSDSEAGLVLGRRVGALVVDRAREDGAAR